MEREQEKQNWQRVKDDSERIYQGTSAKQQQLQSAYQNGATNEFSYVWNTHVIPLQEQYRKASEGWGKAIALCDDQIIKTIDLESDNKLLREEITKCKDLAWEAANEISRLNKEIERLKAEVLREKFPPN